MNLHFLKGIVMWYMHLPCRIKMYQRNNERNLARIRQKTKINVVFFASNVAQWRYQHLYEEMQKYCRFKPLIVLSPSKNSSKEDTIKEINELRGFFDAKRIKYFDYDTDKMQGYDVLKLLSPDILFYPKPYYTEMVQEHRYYRFEKSLLCYYPYGFNLKTNQFCLNEDFHNRAWRLYYASESNRFDAQHIASNKGINVRVTGYPNFDDFLQPAKDVWKPQNRKKKRLIWAPHFTVNGDGWSQNTAFLWMADFMISIATKYQDQLQIAFKPHPKLLSELYRHPNWGKEKADRYYQRWENGLNTQLETGEFIELFKTSDAMVHDSGSFAAEYLCTGNPVMFTTMDMQSLSPKLTELGKKIFNCHYIGSSIEDIDSYIYHVVLNGQDPKIECRKQIRDEIFVMPNGKTVAENTMDDLIKSLS